MPNPVKSAAPSGGPSGRGAPSGLFSGVEKAQVTVKRENCDDGFEGIVEVTKIDYFEARPPSRDAYFLVEFKIIESIDESKGRVGQTRKWMIPTTNDAFLGNAKAFYAALVGAEMDAVTENDCEGMLDPDTQKELLGTKVGLSVRRLPTKVGKVKDPSTWGPKDSFLAHTWEAVPADAIEPR